MQRKPNATSAYAYAASHGFPLIRGDGRPSKDGKTWMSRFTSPDGKSVLFVGWNGKQWIVETTED